LKNKLDFSQRYTITLISLGHLLELYVYTLYGVMIPFLAPVFFGGDFETSIILGYISFAVAFLVAPLGSLFWGWVGDKFGRLKLVNSSVILMGIPSLVIAILPGYLEIGFLAAIIVTACRVLQGLSASGEVMGAKIYLMETVGKEHYGKISGINSAAGAIGVMAAMLMGLLSASMMEKYPNFWRVPFMIGSILCVIGIIIKRTLKESNDFKKLMLRQNVEEALNIKQIFHSMKKASLFVFLLGGLVGVLSYSLHAFMTPFLISKGLTVINSYQLAISGLCSTMITSVIVGIYSDRKKEYAKFLYLINKYICFSYMLGFGIIMLSPFMILKFAGFIIIGAILGAYTSVASVVMYKAFPIQSRCRGVLFFYSIGVAVCGGATPLLLKLIGKYNDLLPAVVITLFVVMVTLVQKRLNRESFLY